MQPAPNARNIEGASQSGDRVRYLENELSMLRDRLQSTAEELETANEKLKSSNEELQAAKHQVGGRVAGLAQAGADPRNLLAATRIAAVFMDTALRVAYYTPEIAVLLPLAESDIGRPVTDVAPLVPYQTLPQDALHVVGTLDSLEREIGLPDGPHYRVRVLPWRDAAGAVAGAVLTIIDVTAEKKMQDALRRGQERTRFAAAAARMFTWEISAATGAAVYTPAPVDVLGFGIPADMEGMLLLVHPEDRSRQAAALAHALRTGGSFDGEYRMVPPGHPAVWLRTQGASQGGRLIGVTQDVSGRKKLENRQKMLFSELQHRVKNILAVVRSISARTLERAPSMEAYAAHFGGRLEALARVQGVLARGGANGVELEDVVRDELAVCTARDGEQIVVAGPRVLLKDRPAEMLALALHELTTNAVKYGALSMPDGKVKVVWQVAAAKRSLVIRWHESGVAALDSRPSRVGFGRDLIERGLPYDLGAVTSLAFAPGGVRCKIVVPLSDKVSAAGAS